MNPLASRLSRLSLFVFFAVPFALAQAPLIQDAATALRQARLDWTLGQAPQVPSSLPSLEVGWGGADSEGGYAPLIDGEGLGHGTQGWGVGLQGRYVHGGWSCSVTMLALREHGHTEGVLQRAALAYQTDSGWRFALEQMPAAWGSGLNGGDLLGAAARPFPRLSLTTPEASLPLGRWRVEAFLRRLEPERPIPAWLPDREARNTARAAGFDLQKQVLWGGLLRGSFGPLVEVSLGAITMTGGQDGLGQPAPASSARSEALAELRVRLPALAAVTRARGASGYLSRSGAPDNRAWTLLPARDLGGLHLVWDGWDLCLEYAGAAHPSLNANLSQPTYLAAFSTRGDALGPAFGRGTITRTVDLGLPLFLEGQGRLKAVRATADPAPWAGTGSWYLQLDAQWRTATGKVGTTLGSRRDDPGAAAPRWGWAASVFQSFRVF